LAYVDSRSLLKKFGLPIVLLYVNLTVGVRNYISILTRVKKSWFFWIKKKNYVYYKL